MSKKAYSDSELENLWLIYRETRSPEIREEIVHIYLDLVNIVAGRLAISLPSYIEKDELIELYVSERKVLFVFDKNIIQQMR